MYLFIWLFVYLFICLLIPLCILLLTKQSVCAMFTESKKRLAGFSAPEVFIFCRKTAQRHLIWPMNLKRGSQQCSKGGFNMAGQN